MKKSPLNNAVHGGRPYGVRHAPYNWKSHENAYGRGYQPAEGNSYQHFSGSNTGSQPHDDDFIPLNISTPLSRHKYNSTNRYTPSGGRGSPGRSGNGWHNNYRGKGNYHATPRSNNRNPAYKYSPDQFQRQKRKSYRGAYKHMNISAYVDLNSFLEDPWENLVKKLNNSKDISKSEGLESESPSSSKLVYNNLLEKSESQLSKDTSLDDSQCSQDSKNECSVNTTNTNLSQISEINSLLESETGGVCSSQDSLTESICSVNDKICGAIQENSIHSNMSLTDIEQKAVQQ
ncbi:PREDICTED: uncharacterized protein LOC108776988 [Cyphomyrmex costatus]|uniref:Uncharacterized protein n=1 Tax=Cyphomyrmex costatus TaxID=456900 RepID=A0A195CGA4_9HYME|nr:PREDICTED: uncharacterized protein LOC108776988 [Cyphomyrmex costatus]KYM99118.1 hypothetical protein ALC62_10087 [Cyphomyrmex costatus]